MHDCPDELRLDPKATVANITGGIRAALRSRLNRRGLVVAVSGGIDSSVCAALAVEAVGCERVFGLLLPEMDSSEDGQKRAGELVRHLGISYEVKDITAALEEIGCYSWRDNAIRSLFPGYDDRWKNKIAIQGGLVGQINHFKLIVEDPAGVRFEAALPLHAYLAIVAATNFKQRIRKTLEYCHADRLNYAVVGTPNRLEYDQGFFVKNGDGSADIKPIAHLYKSQVYLLADYLNLPEKIRQAPPTTDTYSLEQGQDEFYFALPYHQMDLALWHFNHDKPVAELALRLGTGQDTAQLIYKDIVKKRKTSRYLHAAPWMIESVAGSDP